MKAENTEAIRTGLNEENLGFVSGGTEDGKIGPRDARIVQAKTYIKESQELLKQAKDVLAPELDDNLKRAFNALDTKTAFNISEAVVLLKRSIPLVDLFVRRESLRMVLMENFAKARKILEPMIG